MNSKDVIEVLMYNKIYKIDEDFLISCLESTLSLLKSNSIINNFEEINKNSQSDAVNEVLIYQCTLNNSNFIIITANFDRFNDKLQYTNKINFLDFFKTLCPN